MFDAATHLVSGARWFDPEQVDRWEAGLDRTRPVAVYCVHGHAISRATAIALKVRGFDAHYVGGGIESWTAQGLPLESKRGGTA